MAIYVPPLSLDLLKLVPLFGPPQKLAPPPYHTMLACPPLTLRSIPMPLYQCLFHKINEKKMVSIGNTQLS